MAKSRVPAITAGVLLTVGAALVVWAVVGDRGMRWGVIGSVLIGFAAVEAYVAWLNDAQRVRTRGLLYVLTPMLSGGLFAAAVIQERPAPPSAAILARGTSAVGVYGDTALTWGLDGLRATTGEKRLTIGKSSDPDAFFDEPVVATREVVVDVRGESITAYDPISGEVRWTRTITHIKPFRAFSDLLVYRSDAHTGALDLRTGEDQWRLPGEPTLGRGGVHLSGTDSAWDLNGASSHEGLIAQESYVGLRVSLHRLDVVDVSNGEVVRSERMKGFDAPYAVAGDFLYWVREERGVALPLSAKDTDGPAREVTVRASDEVGIEDKPGYLFESRYPGFPGAMPDGWDVPEDVDARIESSKHGDPIFPVSSGDRRGVWFSTTKEVIRVEDDFDDLIAYSYDGGTYVQIVSDRDAVGRRYDRLDVVRDGAVTSFTMPDHEEEALSLRDGLVCAAYRCRSVADLLR